MIWFQPLHICSGLFIETQSSPIEYLYKCPDMKKIILLLLPLLTLNSCHVGRFFVWNFAGINDYKKFPARTVVPSGPDFQFADATDSGVLKMPREITLKQKAYTFEEAMEKSGTVAYLVIRNDSILYEQYFNRYDQASVVPSFSIAKSFVSALVGIAIDEGHIKSTMEPVTRYLTDLDEATFGNITIEHLLNMRSGIRFNEGYFNPFGDVAKYYYGVNMKKYIRKHTIRQAPDQSFDYISLNTQLLSLVVEKATGKTIDAYLQEKIWQPLGMEYDATWSVDSRKNGTVKAFCCLNARARDFAKFGRLYLHNGNWNGRQIVSEEWVRRSTVFDKNLNNFIYSYQWWHTVDARPLIEGEQTAGLYRISTAAEGKYLITPGPDFYAQGILGQFVYVYPTKNMIVVRMGKKESDIRWPQLAKAIAENN